MNFDGREVAKAHVQRLDLEVLLKVSCRRERGRRRGEEMELGLEREEKKVREEKENAVLSRPWTRGGHSYRRCSHSCDRGQKILTISFVA